MEAWSNPFEIFPDGRCYSTLNVFSQCTQWVLLRRLRICGRGPWAPMMICWTVGQFFFGCTLHWIKEARDYLQCIGFVSQQLYNMALQIYCNQLDFLWEFWKYLKQFKSCKRTLYSTLDAEIVKSHSLSISVLAYPWVSWATPLRLWTCLFW